MQCACGITNAPNAKFCKGCGNKVITQANTVRYEQDTCPTCQTTLKPNAKFCGKCGYKLNTASELPQIEAPIVKSDKLHTTLTQEITISCVACGAKLKSGTKFCSSCGHKPDEVTAPSALSKAPETTLSTLAILESPPTESQEATAASTQYPKEISLPTSAQISTDPLIKHEPFQTDRLDPKRTNKKLVLIVMIALVLIAAGIAAWFFLINPNNKTSKSVTTETSSTPVNPPSHSYTLEAVAQEQTGKPVNLLADFYIGKTVKPNTFTEDQASLYIRTIHQTKNAIVLEAIDEVNQNTKMVLVTDITGKVTDGKDIAENDKALVEGENGCLLNKKPYSGIYAITTIEKLAPPTAVWKLNESGKLTDQTVANLQCGAYFNISTASGDVIGIIPHNVLHKPAASKPVSQHKKSKPQSSTVNKPSSATPVEHKTEEVVVQQTQQDKTPAEQPKIRNKKGLGDFFEILGDSVTKGATESGCTQAQQAMNQCN